MSDVSGIPYMGPMGQGNFFAPSFSYNPQMSAGQIQSNYMPEYAQNQNVLSNLYASGGGFGQQTNYYSGLGAQYSAMGQSPYGIFSNQGGSGGGASPYQTSSSVWDTGASPFQGGGGSSGMGGSIYDFGGLGSLGASPYQTTPNVFDTGSRAFQNFGGAGAIDWGGLFNQGSQNAGRFGADMFGGLAGGMGGAYQGPQQQMDFGSLFGRGVGGAQADPYPGMKMPGGLGSPMSTPQQQPADYGSLFGRGAGGTSGAPQTTSDQYAPAPMPSAADQGAGMFGGLGGAGATPGSSAIDWSKLFGGMFGGGSAKAEKTDPAPGMSMPGGLNSPMTTQAQQPLDYGSLFGRGAGGTGQPQPVSTEGFDTGTGKPDTTQLYTQPDTQPADSLAEQARAKLADLMNPMAPEAAAQEGEAGRAGMVGRTATGEDPNPFEGERVPMPRERPEGADALRPSADIPPQDLGYLQGRGPGDLAGVNKQFVKAMQEFAREYNGSNSDYSMSLRSGLRSAGQGFHTSGNAMDINLIDRRNGERLNDYQTRDPVVFKAYQDNANQFHTFLENNYPDLAAGHRWGGYFGGDTSVYGAQDIMHHDLGGNFGKGMAGGSWAGGLSQQSADTWGLPYGGGTKTPWPTFNLFPNDPENRTALTYKSGGSGGVPTSVYQLDAEGNRIAVPILSPKAPGETTPYQNRGLADAPRPPGEIPNASAAPPAQTTSSTDIYPGENPPRPPADIPAAESVPLPTARPAEANIAQAHTLLNTTVGDLVQKNSPSDAGRVPSSIATQTLREALGNTITGGLIRSSITPYLPQLGVSPAEFDKAYTQGRQSPPRFGGDFGEPSEYTSRYAGRIPETAPNTFAPSPYTDFRQSEDIIDQRAEPGRGRLELGVRLGMAPPNPGMDPHWVSNPDVIDRAEQDTPISRQLGLENLKAQTAREQEALANEALSNGPTQFMSAEPRDQLAALQAQADAAQQLTAKYGPEALWAAQGQSQFPQGQTQPLFGNDVSRMPYTQQSPVPGASFPVQLYDDQRYGQAEAPPEEAPPQPFPGASEVTQQPYQSSRSDEGNPFFSPIGGDAAQQAAARTNLEAMFGGSEGRMAEYSTRIDAMAADMPANTKFNLLGAAYDTKGKILDQVQGFIANRDWQAVDASANSRLRGGGSLGIQFGGAGEEPVIHPDTEEDETTALPGLPGSGAKTTMQYGDGAGGRNFDETFSAFPAERFPQPDMGNFQSPANDYNTFQQYPFIPPWQASIKDTVNSPEMRDAIQQTAQQQGVKPAAVAGVVNTEDPGWNPRLRDPDSSYVGLTQMGPDTWRSPGMPGIPSFNEYAQNFTGPEQIQAYSQWLDTYGALDRARAAGIDVSALSAEQQAALLQGLQFSPNAGSSEPGSRDWLTPYAQGNADMATTLTRNQAPFLVDPATQQPTMNTMTDYYRRLMADQVAGAERRWPQQQLFNTYYPTRMGGQ